MTPAPPPADAGEEPTPPTPTPPPAEVIITRIPYPKWWKELHTAAINLSDAGDQWVIPGRAARVIFVATIVFTVTDETEIILYFGSTGKSGPMHFGGDGEPKGIVIAMGNSPAACGPEGFSIQSNGIGAAVGGFVTYYIEKE
jgi:hypothetical protein